MVIFKSNLKVKVAFGRDQADIAISSRQCITKNPDLAY